MGQEQVQMNLLNEIQSEITNPSIHLPDILRKAKVLAYQLQSNEMKTWVNMELDGYNDVPSAQIPEYRKISTQSFGDFLGSFGAQLKNAPLSPATLPKELRSYATNFYVRQGIRGLEGLIAANEHSLRFLWSQNNVLAIQDKIYDGYNCVQAWWVVNNSAIEQILDTVRNRLLSFVLELDPQDIVVDSANNVVSASSTEKFRKCSIRTLQADKI